MLGSVKLKRASDVAHKRHKVYITYEDRDPYHTLAESEEIEAREHSANKPVDPLYNSRGQQHEYSDTQHHAEHHSDAHYDVEYLFAEVPLDPFLEFRRLLFERISDECISTHRQSLEGE